MPKGKYKKYYGVDTTHQIPRSTSYYWSKQNDSQQLNHVRCDELVILYMLELHY